METDPQQDIISRLRDIREAQSRPPATAIVDPTANVLSLVAAAIKRQDDLREQSERYQEKLAIAEAKRLDAVLAVQKSDVALANEKASATATTLAAQVTATREALEKRLSLIEQNQYSTGGGVAQRSESRQQYQWVIGVVIGLIIAIVSVFVRK